MMAAKVRKGEIMRYYSFSGQFLKKLRLKKNLTQTQVAAALGISQSNLSKFEGEDPQTARIPDLEMLGKMGKFYNVFFVADWMGIHTEENDPLDF